MARTTATEIRVRYAETDLLKAEHITIGVLEATCRYHGPAWFDDLLTVQIFLQNGGAVAIPARVRAVLEA